MSIFALIRFLDMYYKKLAELEKKEAKKREALNPKTPRYEKKDTRIH